MSKRPADRRPLELFSVDRVLELADHLAAYAPAKDHIVRPVRRGELVFRFALPLRLCLTGNPRVKAAGWQHAKTKREVHQMMRAQWLQSGVASRWELPLKGRPQVLCLRLSTCEPDAYSNWSKVPVDLLTLPSIRKPLGMSVITDDRPALCEVVEWWEPGPKSGGGCVFEVRSGEI